MLARDSGWLCAVVSILGVLAGCEATMGPGRDHPPAGHDGAPPVPPFHDGGPAVEDDAATDPDGHVPPPPPMPTCEGAGGATAFTLELLREDGPDLTAPGRGAEQWHDRSDVDVPTEGSPVRALDRYHRFTWTQFERGEGEYDWTDFDEILHESIDNGQKLGFGIMSACPGCPTDYNGMVNVDGSPAAYPEYLHDRMQSEPVRDWVSDGYWVPNWNSESYLARHEALLRAIDAHLATGTHSGVRYRDAIGYIDVRGYGSWGEWHVAGIADDVDDQPAGRATPETLRALIDMHVEALPSHQLVLMIAAFDGGRFGNMGTPVEVSAHALHARNEAGPLGWRRDNWGEQADYIRWLLDWNDGESGGIRLSEEIMNRWQTAPVVGEPLPFESAGSCPYEDIEAQVRLYHAASFGNGNFGGLESHACMREHVRAAARAAGYRIVIEGGSSEPVLRTGGPVAITLSWRNLGLAPTYEHWDVVYELRASDGSVAWSGTSTFSPRLFLPQDTATEIRDDLALPDSIAAGSYDLVVVVRDPTGFRAPLPLANAARGTDGSYFLRTVEVVPCPASSR
jgi:hypothetical protein